MQDPYETLQVSRRAEPEVIAAAYRSLARKYHPDANASAQSKERMQEINAAYEILRDPVRRKAYDREHPFPAGRVLWGEGAMDWSADSDPDDSTAWAGSYARRRANPQPIPRKGFLESNWGCVLYVIFVLFVLYLAMTVLVGKL
jgi:curved DNA-binding protein CbpA